MFDYKDLAIRALKIEDVNTGCTGGSWCPRCRLAEAMTHLTIQFDLPITWGDGMLLHATCGIPSKTPWGKKEADEVLEKVKGYE
jgi:hypothetical protein